MSGEDERRWTTITQEPWTREEYDGTVTAILLVDEDDTVRVQAEALRKLLWEAGWRKKDNTNEENKLMATIEITGTVEAAYNGGVRVKDTESQDVFKAWGTHNVAKGDTVTVTGKFKKKNEKDREDPNKWWVALTINDATIKAQAGTQATTQPAQDPWLDNADPNLPF